MKVLIVAALLSCFALQVFAQPMTKEDENNAHTKCIGDKEKADTEVFVCYFKELEVMENGQINQKKLEELFVVLFDKVSDDQRTKLAKICAEEGNKGKDEGEKADKLIQCIRDKYPEAKDGKL